MSGTSASISILYKDKKIKTISTNYDGNISHTGLFLFKNYLKIKDVEELINGGNISAIGGAENNSDNHPARTFLTKKEYYEQCSYKNYNYLFNEEDFTWYLVKSKKMVKLCKSILKM